MELKALAARLGIPEYPQALEEIYRTLPADFRVLLVSGEDDPVGNYGRGVREVASRLEKQGRRVTCLLYPGARHEILNDFTYETVRNDILAFLRDP